MTMQEASKRYHIPMHILQEYQRWGLCGAVKNVMSDWQYDDADLERLSIIMTLHDIGFTAEEVETYRRIGCGRILCLFKGGYSSGCSYDWTDNVCLFYGWCKNRQSFWSQIQI